MSKTHREGIQLCKTANTSHSLFSSSKHLMLTLPLNLMQNVNVNWQFDAFIKSVLGQLSLSHAQSFHVLKMHFQSFSGLILTPSGVDSWTCDMAMYKRSIYSDKYIHFTYKSPVMGFLRNPATTVSIDVTCSMYIKQLLWVYWCNWSELHLTCTLF